MATNICNMPGGCISGYFDGHYSVEQRAEDFAIGFAAGAAGYAIGGITTAGLVEYGLGEAIAEVAAPALRIGLLSTLNVAEAGLSALAHGDEFNTNDVVSAAVLGFFGGLGGEVAGGTLSKWTKLARSRAFRSWLEEWNVIPKNKALYAALRVNNPNLLGLSRADLAHFGYQLNQLNQWAEKDFVTNVQNPYQLRRALAFLGITSLSDVEPYGSYLKIQLSSNPRILIPGRH